MDKPVPPPIATMLGPLFNLLLTLNASTKNVFFSGARAFLIELILLFCPIPINTSPIAKINGPNNETGKILVKPVNKPKNISVNQ